MNRRKLPTRIAIVASAIVLIGYITYLLFALTDPNRFKSTIEEGVKSQMDAIELPQPKDGKDASLEQIRAAVNEYMLANKPQDGKDGQNATDAQIQQAVNNYMAAHPVAVPKDGRDGADGKEGKTPQLRCNVEKNRWEVRFGEDLTWQILNGEKVKCTTGGA